MPEPLGQNRLKKCRPWRAKPTTQTVMNTISARPSVTVMWLVGVKAPTHGIIPSRLQTSTNMKIAKISGANRRPSGPTFSSSILRTKS